MIFHRPVHTIFQTQPTPFCIKALDWRPEGRRTRGRPRTTWRRTAEKDRDRAGWPSWSMARKLAQNRVGWKDNRALYTFWCEERWWWWTYLLSQESPGKIGWVKAKMEWPYSLLFSVETARGKTLFVLNNFLKEIPVSGGTWLEATVLLFNSCLFTSLYFNIFSSRHMCTCAHCYASVR